MEISQKPFSTILKRPIERLVSAALLMGVLGAMPASAASPRMKHIKSVASHARIALHPAFHDPKNIRSLELFEIHTKTHLPRTIYWEDGHYVQEGVDKLNNFMADRRTHNMKALDLKAYDELHAIKEQFGAPVVTIVSGYRDDSSQEEIYQAAKKRHKGRPFDVAPPGNSQHEYANAIDFSIPGISAQKLYTVVASVAAGGVGFYSAGFVHIDTDESQPHGHPRRWGFPAVRTKHKPSP